MDDDVTAESSYEEQAAAMEADAATSVVVPALMSVADLDAQHRARRGETLAAIRGTGPLDLRFDARSLRAQVAALARALRDLSHDAREHAHEYGRRSPWADTIAQWWETRATLPAYALAEADRRDWRDSIAETRRTIASAWCATPAARESAQAALLAVACQVPS